MDLIPSKNTSALEYIAGTDFDGLRLATMSASEIATMINRISAAGDYLYTKNYAGEIFLLHNFL